MSYVINNSRGMLVAVIPSGTVNTTATSLALVGQGVTNYGTDEIENYIYLLENFASPVPPTSPVTGQLWYNSETDTMSVWNSANVWIGMAGYDYVQAQKISPAFTGIPTAPTADSSTNTTQLATTAFVQAQKISPAFTGIPTAPTANSGTSTTQLATTEFVVQAVSQASGNISGILGTMASQNANAVTITGGTIDNVVINGSTITGNTTVSVANGGTGASTATGARTNLGLGTLAIQNSDGVNITGGSITNVSGILPPGMIVMWAGSVASIPSGWQLCNGTFGTPDLRNKFIVGAGSSYAVGATGGNANATLVAHTHTVNGFTASTGEHTHNTMWTFYDGGAGQGLIDPVNPGSGDYAVTTTPAGAHNHSFSATTDSSGASATNANLPPYYALCYIMKL